MVIQKKFRSTTEAVIASYDFTDIAEGTGSIVYNLFLQGTSAGTSFGLTAQDLRSADVEIIGAATRNFDLTAFNLPQTIKGTAVFEGVIDQSAAGNMSYTITIKKNTTTIAGPVQSVVETETNINTNFVVPITIPSTNFKKGDVLRVVVQVQGNGTIATGIDPANRDGTVITAAQGGYTNTRISIPFRIDL